MRVTELLVAGKTPDPAACEDVIVVASGYAAVVDGATDKTGNRYRLDGALVSSGLFAAVTVARAIEQMPAHLDAWSAVSAVTAALDAALTRQRPDLADPARAHERPAAALVVFSRARREIWSVGDCQHSVGGRVCDAGKRVDDVAAQMRAVVRAALRASEVDPDSGGVDAGREAILPLLRLQGALAHTPGEFGYGVIDGRPVRREHVAVHPVPAAVREVVLASDGYPVLRGTLTDSESDLVRLLAADPYCEGKLRSTKGLVPGNASFDDRAYLRLAV